MDSLTPFFVAIVMVSANPSALRAETSNQMEQPQSVLTNGALRLTVLTPDSEHGHYRGQRFDWSGMVSQVEFAGHRMFGPFREGDEPLDHDANAVGTAEEFDPKVPPGFDTARPGGWFPKIAVGRIGRDSDKNYRFWHRSSRFEPFPWKIDMKPLATRFEQIGQTADGWGWKYVKTVEVDAVRPVFTIRRSLANTGRRTYDGEHYGHHFFRFDGLPVGPEYRLTLPTSLKPDKPTKATVAGANLSLDSVCRDAFMAFFDELPKDLPHDFAVEHTGAGIRVEVHGNRPLSKFRVYVAPTAFCPEPFTKIILPPGKIFEWSSEYRLLNTNERAK